jgi:hypothetical protein
MIRDVLTGMDLMKVTTMKTSKSAASLPAMMAELTVSSWTTILRRTQLIAEGKCTPAEYQRMMTEKADAARASLMAFTTPGAPNPQAILQPWLSRATANAQRLRRR